MLFAYQAGGPWTTNKLSANSNMRKELAAYPRGTGQLSYRVITLVSKEMTTQSDHNVRYTQLKGRRKARRNGKNQGDGHFHLLHNCPALRAASASSCDTLPRAIYRGALLFHIAHISTYSLVISIPIRFAAKDWLRARNSSLRLSRPLLLLLFPSFASVSTSVFYSL